MATPAAPRPLDLTFTGPLTKERNSGWICVVVPDSGEILGTRNPVKVTGTIDGHPLAATLMPMGDGTHMVPVKAALRKLIGTSELGTEVTIHLDQRLT